jgi:hypothetical protein
LKARGMRLQRHRGHKRPLVAAARKLALILHAMWRDGSEFRFGQAPERRPEGRSSVPRRLENGRAMTEKSLGNPLRRCMDLVGLETAESAISCLLQSGRKTVRARVIA